MLLVHETKPPFLEGQVVNNKQVCISAQGLACA